MMWKWRWFVVYISMHNYLGRAGGDQIIRYFCFQFYHSKKLIYVLIRLQMINKEIN